MYALVIGGIEMDDGDSNTNTAQYCTFIIRNIEGIAGTF